MFGLYILYIFMVRLLGFTSRMEELSMSANRCKEVCSTFVKKTCGGQKPPKSCTEAVPETTPDPIRSEVWAKKWIDTAAEDCYNKIDTLAKVACTSKQEKNQMYDIEINENQTTETERKAAFFVNELEIASWKKRDELRTAYKLDLQNAPENPKQFVEWIKDGKFKFTKNMLNDDGTWRDPDSYHNVYDWMRYISWENPDRDITGFSAAEEKRRTADANAQRAIRAASTGAEMLAALEAFESTTIN